MKTYLKTLFLIFTSILLTGCFNGVGNFTDKSKNRQILAGANDLRLRSMQTRRFDTTDENKVMRAVIATLQDLDFIIRKSDAELGTITADKIRGGIDMTVTVRTRKEIILVRANAISYSRTIEEPEMYQDFFNALQRSLFLVAQEVD